MPVDACLSSHSRYDLAPTFVVFQPSIRRHNAARCIGAGGETRQGLSNTGDGPYREPNSLVDIPSPDSPGSFRGTSSDSAKPLGGRISFDVCARTGTGASVRPQRAGARFESTEGKHGLSHPE
jgi:hypothetical protein